MKHWIFFCNVLLLSVLGLCCHMRAFSYCSRQGLLSIAVRGLPLVVHKASPHSGLSCCGQAQALELGFSRCDALACLP